MDFGRAMGWTSNSLFTTGKTCNGEENATQTNAHMGPYLQWALRNNADHEAALIVRLATCCIGNFGERR